MSSISGGPAVSFSVQYDAKGRRENDTSPNTGTNYYLDSGKTVVLGNNVSGGNQTLSSCVALPGTGEVVGIAELGGLAPQAPGNATPMAPLHDIDGLTLGIAHGSNNTIGVEWSYEPFGTPYQSGPSVNYPFLFEGMQREPFLYSAGIAFRPAAYRGQRHHLRHQCDTAVSRERKCKRAPTFRSESRHGPATGPVAAHPKKLGVSAMPMVSATGRSIPISLEAIAAAPDSALRPESSSPA